MSSVCLAITGRRIDKEQSCVFRGRSKVIITGFLTCQCSPQELFADGHLIMYLRHLLELIKTDTIRQLSPHPFGLVENYRLP